MDPITCTVCGGTIPPGEPCYGLTSDVEIFKDGEAEIHNAEMLALRCLRCGPFDLDALKAVADRPGPAAG